MFVRCSEGRYWSKPYYRPVANGPISFLTNEEKANVPWEQGRILVKCGHYAGFIFPMTTLSARLVDERSVLMQEMYPERDVAFAMAGHSRVGAESLAHEVAADTNLLSLICSDM